MNRRKFMQISGSAAIAGAALDTRIYGVGNLDTNKSNQKAHLDAYVRTEGSTWVIGTSKAERTVTLHQGHLLLASFRNKISGREYRGSTSNPSEIRMNVDGVDVGTPRWTWTLVDASSRRLDQGELQLDIQLRGGPIEVTKHWIAYPGTAIVREWLTIENISNQDVRLKDLFFLNTQLLRKAQSELTFDYLTGGGNFNGSQLLKTERIADGYRRVLDSDIGVQTGNYSAYLPLVLLRDSRPSDNLAVGWDYMGHWSVQVEGTGVERVSLALKAEGYDTHLKPGLRIESPKAFAAALSGDLDEIGNQILDWQYQYLWDFTNPAYFGKTRWAVDWPSPWVGNGGTPCAANWGRRLAMDLRYTELLRESGGEILWDDAGWYDRWGSWNGPDWRLTNEFLKKHGMSWVLWYPTFLATAESAIAQKHPDWLIPGKMWFEQSIPETEEWQKQLLDKSVTDWGEYQWRYDIAPAASATDTKALAADQNFRKLLLEFKTSHPASSVDACDGGGRWISYGIAQFSDAGEYTDGGVGPYTGYYTSLLIPPDKLHNVVDFDHTYYNASSDRTHLTMNPCWYRDPGNGPDLELIRKDWELYRYLMAQGVAGHGCHIFRPQVENDDPVWYAQRMDQEGSKGVIIAKHAKHGEEYYLVSKPLANTSKDRYQGGPGNMVRVYATDAVALDTGIYADPVDQEYRYYGVPGEVFGPLNFRYQEASGGALITEIARTGSFRPTTVPFFGLAFQVGSKPVTITELGQFDPGNNQGTYSLMLVRARDKAVLGSATLDMKTAAADSLGFKYVRLATPIRLDAGLRAPITIFPRGLQPETSYDVRTYHSGIRMKRSGAALMKEGIHLPSVPAGELIFFNLQNYPGSRTDTTPPEPPSKVTKRVGTNLGVQGVELSWVPGRDNNWISYYEVLKNGALIGRAAIGTFFFYHSPDSGGEIAAKYEVRTVDGDGNRSSLVTATEIAGEPETHQPLGEFAPTQGSGGWKYEESNNTGSYRELTWSQDHYEGVWTGSGLGRIGRIWAQPAAAAEISRTFICPATSRMTLSGEIEMDPSARTEDPVFCRIEHNRRQVWPASGWTAVPAFGQPLTYHMKDLAVTKGDVIRFVLKRNGRNLAQPVVWNPHVVIQGT